MSKKSSPKFGAVLNCAPEMIEKSDWVGLRKLALELESLGYDSIWVMDHFTYHSLSAVMESYTTLAALSAVTSKIRLGGLVTCNLYRNPALAAKMAATLDVISNGRLNFGIGAGWKEDECQMYGYDFPDARTRIEQLREGVQIIKKAWTEPRASFRGKHYQIENMQFGPELIQKPHPPIWIGGGGEKYTLRIVAELADFWNIGQHYSQEEYRHKTNVLKKHCKSLNRDYYGIKKSIGLEVIISETEKEARKKMVAANAENNKHIRSKYGYEADINEYKKRRLVGTPEQCVYQLKRWLQLDIDYILVGWTMSLDDWRLFAKKVIPQIT